MKLRLIVASLLVALLVLAAVPAYAVNPDPDSAPTISRLWVNQDLLETGDMLVYFEYNIPYATPPTEYDVSEAFTFSLYDSADTGMIGYNTAFPYQDNGYNYGVTSFYFTAAGNPGWGGTYKIHITGNAGKFASPPNYSFDLVPTDFSLQTTQAGNRGELRDKIISITHDLERRWDMALLDAMDVGLVFSLDGEVYFREAIPQLQFICPDLFYFQLADPVYGSRAWTDNATTAIDAQYTGTAVQTGIQALGNIFEVNPMVLGSILTIVACIALVFIHVRKAASINSGLMDIYPVVLVFSLLGFFPFAIAAFMAFLAWVYLGFILFFRR